ncbi:MAG: ubiquitin fusion degradation protein [Watsoniomyces obsoletus]|nr:MAG: ubiquitin fusion degradation protein [Watsoniomyces obsoletus]
MRDPHLREAPRGPRALIDAPRGPGASTGPPPWYGPGRPRGRGFPARGEYRGRGYRGFRGNRDSYYAHSDRDRDRDRDREWERERDRERDVRHGSNGTAPDSTRSALRDQQESEQRSSSRQELTSNRKERRGSSPPPPPPSFSPPVYGSGDYRSPSTANHSNNPWAERRPERDEARSPPGGRSIGGGREDAEGGYRSSVHHSRSTPVLSERDGASHGPPSGFSPSSNYFPESRPARQEYPPGRYDQGRTRSGSNEGPNRNQQQFSTASARGPIPTGPRADRPADGGGRAKNNQWVRPGLAYPASRGGYGSSGPSPVGRDDVDRERSRYPRTTRRPWEGQGGPARDDDMMRRRMAPPYVGMYVGEEGSPIRKKPVEGSHIPKHSPSKRKASYDEEEGDRKRARRLDEAGQRSEERQLDGVRQVKEERHFDEPRQLNETAAFVGGEAERQVNGEEETKTEAIEEPTPSALPSAENLPNPSTQDIPATVSTPTAAQHVQVASTLAGDSPLAATITAETQDIKTQDPNTASEHQDVTEIEPSHRLDHPTSPGDEDRKPPRLSPDPPVDQSGTEPLANDSNNTSEDQQQSKLQAPPQIPGSPKRRNESEASELQPSQDVPEKKTVDLHPVQVLETSITATEPHPDPPGPIHTQPSSSYQDSSTVRKARSTKSSAKGLPVSSTDEPPPAPAHTGPTDDQPAPLPQPQTKDVTNGHDTNESSVEQAPAPDINGTQEDESHPVPVTAIGGMMRLSVRPRTSPTQQPSPGTAQSPHLIDGGNNEPSKDPAEDFRKNRSALLDLFVSRTGQQLDREELARAEYIRSRRAWYPEVLANDNVSRPPPRTMVQPRVTQVAAPASMSAAAAAPPTPVEGRRGNRFATEYDLQQAIRESEQEAREAEDALHNATTPNAEAVVPHTADEAARTARRIIAENRTLTLRGDGSRLRYVHAHNDFTNTEQQMFVERLGENWKRFDRVAKDLPDRSVRDCVRHYYDTKFEYRYRQRRRGRARKGAARGNARNVQGGRGGRSSALISQVHSTADQKNDEDDSEVPSVMVEKGTRPRRAAAPTFGETPTTESQSGSATPNGASKPPSTPRAPGGDEARPERGGRRGRGAGGTRERGRRGRNVPLLAAPAPLSTPTTAGLVMGPGPTLAPQPTEPDGNRGFVHHNGPFPSFPHAAPPLDVNTVQPLPGLTVQQHYNGDDVGMSGTDESVTAQAPGAGPANEGSDAPRSNARSTGPHSSYWTVPEVADFPRLLDHFGTNWKAIADHMATKSENMVKNYFKRGIGGDRTHWLQRAEEADVKIRQGVLTGPPPTLTQVRRRQDTTVDDSAAVVIGQASPAIPVATTKRRRASTSGRQAEAASRVAAMQVRSAQMVDPFGMKQQQQTLAPQQGPRLGSFTDAPFEYTQSYNTPNSFPWVNDTEVHTTTSRPTSQRWQPPLVPQVARIPSTEQLQQQQQHPQSQQSLQQAIQQQSLQQQAVQQQSRPTPPTAPTTTRRRGRGRGGVRGGVADTETDSTGSVDGHVDLRMTAYTTGRGRRARANTGESMGSTRQLMAFGVDAQPPPPAMDPTMAQPTMAPTSAPSSHMPGVTIGMPVVGDMRASIIAVIEPREAPSNLAPPATTQRGDVPMTGMSPGLAPMPRLVPRKTSNIMALLNDPEPEDTRKEMRSSTRPSMSGQASVSGPVSASIAVTTSSPMVHGSPIVHGPPAAPRRESMSTAPPTSAWRVLEASSTPTITYASTPPPATSRTHSMNHQMQQQILQQHQQQSQSQSQSMSTQASVPRSMQDLLSGPLTYSPPPPPARQLQPAPQPAPSQYPNVLNPSSSSTAYVSPLPSPHIHHAQHPSPHVHHAQHPSHAPVHSGHGHQAHHHQHQAQQQHVQRQQQQQGHGQGHQHGPTTHHNHGHHQQQHGHQQHRHASHHQNHHHQQQQQQNQQRQGYPSLSGWGTSQYQPPPPPPSSSGPSGPSGSSHPAHPAPSGPRRY